MTTVASCDGGLMTSVSNYGSGSILTARGYDKSYQIFM